jgi:hypothetical protein
MECEGAATIRIFAPLAPAGSGLQRVLHLSASTTFFFFFFFDSNILKMQEYHNA